MSEVERISVAGLKVARVLYDFVVHEVIPDSGVEAAAFWQGLAGIIHEFAPRNHALLQRRDELQAKIDDWYRGRRGRAIDEAADKAFLEEIGYLVPEGPPFKIDTANVDAEIASSPARSSSFRSAMRGTRSTRPMRAGGRCTTRSTAPTRSRETAKQTPKATIRNAASW